jgi:5-methylcytosine-specific restriction endonuclease McrA
VLARDGRHCGYCGRTASTVDHVLPRSRGGAHTWLDTVAACGGCNQRKGDRTPSEARMPLRPAPAVPAWVALSLRWDRPAGHHPAGRDGS